MLSHQTKMASMGEMIGNIAHQWRQPLTAISVAAGGIKLNYELDMVDEEEILLELDNIVNNTQFLSTTIEDFQSFLKDDRATTLFSIKQAIDKTLAIIKANLESHEINVIQQINDNIQINAIQNDLIQVLLNIVNNAADILKAKEYNEKEKYIIINVTNNKECLTITVQDSGGGVPNKIINKIFEPYFTTKHQAKGTGLGLYMTHQIVVDNMAGELKVENCEFNYNESTHFGAKFTVKVPIK
jgi:signal transduction histidine kinase